MLGPNEKLWYTNHGTNKVGVITTGGTVTEYTSGAKFLGILLTGITVGPESNVWFSGGGILGNVGT